MSFTIKELYLSADLEQANLKSEYSKGNTDVIVLLEENFDDGEKRTTKYLASFFAYSNIAQLQCEHEATGEFLNGSYFFSKNMLLINEWSFENVRMVINDLIDEGNFRDVFYKL